MYFVRSPRMFFVRYVCSDFVISVSRSLCVYFVRSLFLYVCMYVVRPLFLSLSNSCVL